MSMDIDRSLDDIIKTNKKGRRNTRLTKKTKTPGISPAKKAIAGNLARAAAPAASKKGAAGAAKGGKAGGAAPVLEGNKIVVSNLPEDVTEPQIRELFQTTVGPLKSVSLTYDSRGKSKGIATVEFKSPQDGPKAFSQYNKRLIDQKRPMKVEIIVDPSKVPAAPLTSRIAPAPKAAAAVAGAKAAPSKAKMTAKKTAGSRRGRGKKTATTRPAVSKEDLDQQMTDYQAANTVPAPAA